MTSILSSLAQRLYAAPSRRRAKRGKRSALRTVCINESNERVKGEITVQRADSGDGSTGRVTAEAPVSQGHSRLERTAQGALFVPLGGLLMTLVVISALVFGL
jgi:hypothetical protein